MPYGRPSGCYEGATFLENLNEGTRYFVLKSLGYYSKMKKKNPNTFLLSMLLASRDLKDVAYLMFSAAYKYEINKKYSYDYIDESNYNSDDLEVLSNMCTRKEKFPLLTPTYFICNYIRNNLYNKNLNLSDFGSLDIYNYYILFNQLDEIEKEIANELEEDYFWNVNKDMVNFFKMVGTIYELVNNWYRGYKEEDKKLLSFFCAFFTLSGDLEIYKDVIEREFNRTIKAKFNYDYIRTKINSSLPTFPDEDSVLYLLEYFPEYKTTKIGITELFEKEVYEKYSKDSILAKKVLGSISFPPVEILKRVNAELKRYHISNIVELAVSEKNELNEETQEYFHKCCYYYYMILKSATSEPSNRLFNASVEDTVALAQLICSLNDNLKVGNFFKDNNITTDIIRNLYGVSTLYNPNLDVGDEIPHFFYTLLDGFECDHKDITVEMLDLKLTNYRNTKSELLYELFKIVTGKELSKNFLPDVNKCELKLKRKRIEDNIRKKYLDLDYDVFKYLLTASDIYHRLNDSELVDSERELISLLLPVKYMENYKSGYLTEYFDSVKFDFETLLDLSPKAQDLYHDARVLDVETYHLPSLDLLLNKYGSIDHEALTIENIISNLFNININNSFKGIKLLDRMNIDLEAFIDLEDKLNFYRLEEIDNKIAFLKQDQTCYKLMKKACGILKDLKNNNDVIKDKIELQYFSLLLAFIMKDKECMDAEFIEYYDYFDSACIDLEYITNITGYKPVNSTSIDNITDMDLYRNYKEFIDEMPYKEADIGWCDNYDIGYIIRRLFFKSSLMRRVIKDADVCSSLNDCCNGLTVDIKPSYNSLIEYLKRELNRELEVDYKDLDSIFMFLSCGDNSLRKYSNYITDESICSTENYADNITGQLDNLFEKVFPGRKLFNPKQSNNIDYISIKEFSNVINVYSVDINAQLVRYYRIREVIKYYIELLKKYYNKYVEIRDILTGYINQLDNNNPLYNKLTGLIKFNEEKINSCNQTIGIMSCHLITFNNMIDNQSSIKCSLDTCTGAIIPVMLSVPLFNLNDVEKETAINKLLQLTNSLFSKEVNITGTDLLRELYLVLPKDFVLMLENYFVEKNGNAKVLK